MTKTPASVLVDEFTDNLAKGNIESHLKEFLAMRFSGGTSPLGHILDNMKEVIGNYRLNGFKEDTTIEEREDLAEKALARIIDARSTGLLLNNPNLATHLQQERDFYKAEVSALEKALERCAEQRNEVLAELRKYQAEPKEKTRLST